MDKMELGEIGCTIRRLRAERNFTLKQLSDKTGIQMASLSRMENNKMMGALDSYYALAEAFRMKLSELFQEYEKDRLAVFETEVMDFLKNEDQKIVKNEEK